MFFSMCLLQRPRRREIHEKTIVLGIKLKIKGNVNFGYFSGKIVVQIFVTSGSTVYDNYFDFVHGHTGHKFKHFRKRFIVNPTSSTPVFCADTNVQVRRRISGSEYFHCDDAAPSVAWLCCLESSVDE